MRTENQLPETEMVPKTSVLADSAHGQSIRRTWYVRKIAKKVSKSVAISASTETETGRQRERPDYN